MNIAVVGTGYVGLVSGTCFAESGNEVICVDIDAARIEQLKAGQVPIYEPGLEELVRRNIKEGRLSFTTDLKEAVGAAMVSFIAVGTPMSKNGAADLSGVLRAAEEVAKAVAGYHIIAIKSTVPVGTNDRVREIVARAAVHRVDVCSCPEFLKEGSAIEDFMRPDRVVIGSASEQATAILRELHAAFLRTDNPMLVMDPRSAELTKYASNAMLAMRISFINEMANLCEAVGAEINDVRRGMGSDRRIGSQFLFPGVGYGGSCFPKDVQALIHSAAEHSLDFACCARRRGQRAAETARGRARQAAFRRRPARPHVRDMGAGLQAAHRRHARGAVAHGYRRAAGRGRQCAGARSRSARQRAAHLRRPHHLSRDQLRGAGRGRRADDPHRVERIPPSELPAHPHDA